MICINITAGSGGAVVIGKDALVVGGDAVVVGGDVFATCVCFPGVATVVRATVGLCTFVRKTMGLCTVNGKLPAI